MKQVKFNLKYVVILMVSVAFFSCSDGEDGLMGLPGQDGIDGINGQDGTDGADGADGADGEDGNANVIISDWIDTEFSTMLETFTSFEITPSSFDSNGAILVYGRDTSPGTGNNGIVRPIPFELFNERYSYEVDPGEGTFPNVTLTTIVFTARSVDGSDEVFDRIGAVRYVNIPSQASGKSSSIDFEKMTYEEVIDYFGLDY